MDNVRLLEAFRDFFYHGKKEKMEESYAVMKEIFAPESEEEINWEEEEFVFNRLFIGPMRPLAPAVASCYIDPEGLVQGRITADVREFYHAIGLSLPEAGKMPEDSVEFEFDACRYLLLAGEKMPEMYEAYEGFIKEHMNLWIPEFVMQAKEHCGDSKGVRNVLNFISKWIQEESEMTLVSKELS